MKFNRKAGRREDGQEIFLFKQPVSEGQASVEHVESTSLAHREKSLTFPSSRLPVDLLSLLGVR